MSNVADDAFGRWLEERIDVWREIGMETERNRIIKLLEEMRDTCFDTKTELGDHNGWTLQNAIALIKGENK